MALSPLTRWNLIAVAATLAGVTVAWILVNGEIFSPGDLNRGDAGGPTFGGVASHAELSRDCGACHAPPWSDDTMDDRCLACHTDVQVDIRDSLYLHGIFARATRCLACHTDHLGPAARIVRFDPSELDQQQIDHARLGFPLTGAHEPLECAACHAGATDWADFARTPNTCVGCHRADDVHRGEFGTDCASCHSTAAWEEVSFEHTFPLTHGSRRPVACDVCHQDAPRTYRTYTCYGCHEHTPRGVRAEHLEEGIRDFQECVRCHPTGREEESERERRR